MPLQVNSETVHGVLLASSLLFDFETWLGQFKLRDISIYLWSDDLCLCFFCAGNSEVLSLEQVYVVTQQHVVTQQTSMDGNVVFYAWNHENFKGLLCYFIKTYLNDTLISNISMPRESVNGSHNIPNNMYGQLRVEVEAVDLCYGRVSRDKTIRKGVHIPNGFSM